MNVRECAGKTGPLTSALVPDMWKITDSISPRAKFYARLSNSQGCGMEQVIQILNNSGAVLGRFVRCFSQNATPVLICDEL